MKDGGGFEICEEHLVILVQAQGELNDHCPECRRIEEELESDEGQSSVPTSTYEWPV